MKNQLITNLIQSSLNWEFDASFYLGTRREWRLRKSAELMDRARALV